MALDEGTDLVPGTTGSLRELEDELRALEQKVGAISRLEGYSAIVSQHAHSDRRSALTLELKRREQELTVTVHERIADAERRLAELEARDDENLDAVLVNVSKIGQLESAYPNYYANSSAFTEFLRSHM
jgi:Skp family chaperone for outer membrane proteins